MGFLQSRPLLRPLRHPLFWLALATVLLTLLLEMGQPYAARAFQSESPPPTNTPFPTSTPVPSSTPIPTDTPFPTPIPTVPPAVVTVIPSPTPELPPPFPPTAVPPALALPQVPALATTAPALVAAPVVSGAITITAESQIVAVSPEKTETTQPNADALVRLIDTFVLYSAYFLLGCGFLVFVAAAIGFYFLNRRARQLAGREDETKPPPV